LKLKLTKKKKQKLENVSRVDELVKKVAQQASGGVFVGQFVKQRSHQQGSLKAEFL